VKSWSQIVFEELPQFKRDFKQLKKRFPSLDEDFRTFKNTQLKLYHALRMGNEGIFPIEGLGITYPVIYKAKKFACKSLKGKGVRSGIRVIYAYFKEEHRIEFIEIYYKGDKTNENRERILKKYGKS